MRALGSQKEFARRLKNSGEESLFATKMEQMLRDWAQRRPSHDARQSNGVDADAEPLWHQAQTTLVSCSNHFGIMPNHFGIVRNHFGIFRNRHLNEPAFWNVCAVGEAFPASPLKRTGAVRYRIGHPQPNADRIVVCSGRPDDPARATAPLGRHAAGRARARLR